jgi:hypothetical protein
MELLTALRVLARRRVLVLLGALAAGALGAAVGGYLAIGPFGSPELRSAVATVKIQVDTPRPLATDIWALGLTIGDQATMLGERLTADDTRKLIAREAGVPFEDLAVRSSRTAIVGRPSALARSAVDAASASGTPYRLTVYPAIDAPIVSIVTAGPDARTVTRLAAAATPALRMVIDVAPDTVKQRLVVKPLAAPHTIAVHSGGTKPLFGVLAALIAFVGWCWFVVVAGGVVRALRARPPEPAPTRP